MITYGKQKISKNDIVKVNKVIKNQFLSSGLEIEKFEKNLKKYLSCKYVKVCNSGTSAIELALDGIGVKKNDIVLMPSINFIAAYNLCSKRSLKIYLIDVDPITGQITEDNVLKCIKKNKIKKIDVFFSMYLGGYVYNLDYLFKLKKKYRFRLIEDACHALGSTYIINKNKYKVGSCKYSDVATFSFHPLKSITTGEGGAVCTNFKYIDDRINFYRSHGIKRNKSSHWKYDVVLNGNNYRLSDINCALGSSQLAQINSFFLFRKKIYSLYFKEFENFSENLKLVNQNNKNINSYHLIILNINFDALKKNKDFFIKYMKSKKIICQFHYTPIYHFSVFKEKIDIFDFNGSENYFLNAISIPIFYDLSYFNQKKIIFHIKNFINKFKKNTYV